jgi:hypothetical protein
METGADLGKAFGIELSVPGHGDLRRHVIRICPFLRTVHEGYDELP